MDLTHCDVIRDVQGSTAQRATEVDMMQALRERRKHNVEPIGDNLGNRQGRAPAGARKRHSKYSGIHVVRRWWQSVAEYWRYGPIGLEVSKGIAIDAGVELPWWDHWVCC